VPPGDPELRPDQEVATGGVRKGALLAGVIFVVVLADYLSKEWIVANIPMYSRRSVIGDFLRLTYTHNPGAAFGMNIGEHSRLFFLVLALVALVAPVALIAAGAIGNILDRLRYEAGVVDFIDVGIGDLRFWTFNVADSAVSVGAVLLLISFWREERRAREEGTETAAG
jgi:signal peptidase II